jgi:hypothetical protein
MSRKFKVLIVACIAIGFLIAIAIPGLIQSRSTSSAQACLNNLRDIDLAMVLRNLEVPNNRLALATEAFVSDRKSRGGSVPATVTLSALVAGGYLASGEVALLTNAEVTVSLRAAQTDRKAIWVHVRWADGFETAQLVDKAFIDGKYVSKWWR